MKLKAQQAFNFGRGHGRLATGLMAAASPLAVGHAMADVVAAPGGPTTVTPAGAGVSTVTTNRVTTGADGVGVGLNTFSQFNVGSGLTVNLMVPTNASSLVNVVRDSSVRIDGIVNSYKAGMIGGDVYFVAPQGFVVGATGVVNVGSLNVATTTTALADTVTTTGTDILATLSASDIPLAVDGSIVVSGRVNAYDGASLRSRVINVASGAQVNTGQTALTSMQALFAGTVNATAIPSASALRVGGGVIELVADQTQTADQGQTSSASSIDISGGLNGSSISLTASATAESDWTTQVEGITTTALTGLLTGLSGAYVKSSGTATINLHSGADLETAGAIDVNALTITKSDMPLLDASAGKLAISVVVAQLAANAAVSVESGAVVRSTAGDLSFTAKNTATLGATSFNIQLRAGYTADTAAAVTGTVNSSVNVAHGATIVGRAVDVAARNDNSISVSATTFATKDTKAGISVAYSDVSDSATANFGADLGSAAAKAVDLHVSAFSNTSKNSIVASTSLGSGIAATALSGANGEIDGIPGEIASKVGAGLAGIASKIGDKISAAQSTEEVGGTGKNTKATPQIGSALSISTQNHTATATIGSSTTPTTIYTSGETAAAAQTSDDSISNETVSSVATASSQDANAPAFSATVSYADYNHTTAATIAPRTKVNAATVLVNAQTLLPAGFASGSYDSPADIYNNLSSSTSRDAAVGDSDGLDFTGVVNLTNFTDSTRAWVGQGAQLISSNALGASGSGSYTVDLDSDWQIVSAAAVDVEALHRLQTVEISGEFSFKDVLTTSHDPGGTSIGGSFTNSVHTSTTLAGIDADAVVTTPGALTVKALNNDFSVAMAPNSGQGANIGVSGMVSRAAINDTTHAEISSTAQVAAPVVALSAEDIIHVINVAAVVQSTANEAVGAGVALSHVASDTAAFVGDTLTDSPTSAVGTRVGYVHADTLNVSGHTGGYIATLGVAGANVSGDGKNTNGDAKSGAELPKTESDGDGEPTFQVSSGGFLGSAKAALASVSTAVGGVKTKIAGKLGLTSTDTDPVEEKPAPAFSLNLAGSVAYNQSNLNTRAELNGAQVDRYTTGRAIATTVTAISDPVLVSGAGAGARLSSSSTTKTSASVAAAVTLDASENRAQAKIQGGTLQNAGTTSVRALNGGVRASAALGLAVTTQGSTALSGEGAGSASILINKDSAGAYVDAVTITGATGASARNLDVTAYNAAYMGAGGGSGFSGGQGGLGLSFTFLATLDPTGHGATEAEVTGSALRRLDAISVRADDSSVLAGLSIDASTGSKTAGVNLSAVDIDMNRRTTALLSGGSVDAGSLSVASDGLRQASLDSVLLAGAPSLASLSGYDFATGGLPTELPADPSGDATVDIASGRGALVILAAGAGGEGENTAGAAVVAAQFRNSHTAALTGRSVQLTGDLSVRASDDALIVGAAIGAGAASGQFAGVGSVAVLQSGETVSATLGSSADKGSDFGIKAANVDVRAADASTLAGLAGAVSVSEGSAAFGASVALVTSANKVSAIAQHAQADLTADHFTTRAEANGLFVDLAVTGAVSDKFSLGGAATANIIDNGVQARLDTVVLRGGPDTTVNVESVDTSSIYSGALGFAVGSTGAAGIAIAANAISAPSDWSSRVSSVITGGDVQAKDVKVSADSQSSIVVAAAGGAVGDNAGVAGSIVANVTDGDTRALINGGARVTAANNVGVIASSQDSLLFASGAVGFGGEGVGIGISSGINLASGDTEAAIIGAQTTVDGRAKSATDTLIVADGALTSQPDMGDITSATGYLLRDITLSTHAVTGVAVNATSRERIGALSLGIGIAGEGVAAAVNAVVDDLSGTTTAHVDNARVNSSQSGSARQMLDITAADHAFDQSLVASIAGSGPGAAGAAAINVAGMSRTTKAYASNADLRAVGAMRINAQSSQHEVGLVLGLAGSLVAGGGSTAVTTFNADTSAYATGGRLIADSLDITAGNIVGTNVNTGALAGGAVGAAASFDVVTSSNLTYAGLGSGDNGATSAATNVSTDALNVSASRDADYLVHVVGGAVGGVGVAGMGAILLSSDDTEAGVYNATVVGLNAAAAESATVAAQENASADLIAGSLSVGGTAGLGAAVGVIVSSSTVGATLSGSAVRSQDTSVTSQSSKDYRAIMASAGGGATIGGEAGVGVILIGTSGSAGGDSEHVTGSDVFDEAQPVLEQITALNSLDIGGDASSQSGGGLTTDQATRVNATTQVTLPGSTDVGGSAVLANVTGSQVRGDLTVDAQDTIATQQYVGALALGGSIGVGANLGYTNIADTVTANVDPTVSTREGSVTVGARTLDGDGHAGEVNSYVGAGGAVGIAAAASIINLDTHVSAKAGGALDGGGHGVLSVAASDGLSALNKTYNASVGGVAAGAVVSESLKTGTVLAQTAPSGNPSIIGFDRISVSALSSGALNTEGLAAAGGVIGAGDAVYTLSKDAMDVSAVLGQGSYANVADGVTLTALRTPNVSSKARGVAVSGGAALGASIAQSFIEGSSRAYVADGALIGVGQSGVGPGTDVTVSAGMALPGGGRSAYALAQAGAGGYFGGIDATFAQTHNTSAIDAHLGQNVGLADGGELSITADRHSLQSSESSGVAVGGGLAAGANLADATVGGSIRASVGSGLKNADTTKSIVTLAALTLKAGTGTTDGDSLASPESDSARASAFSGSGAALAAAAAKATTDNTTVVAATIADAADGAQPVVVSGSASILTDYTADTIATADSLQAALAGGSGSVTDRKIQSNVASGVGANVSLVAANLTVSARANNNDHDSGIKVGAGGAINASAGVSGAEINPTSSVQIGAGASLGVTDGAGDLRLSAVNFGAMHDNSVMTTGGAVQIPVVDVTLENTSTQTITLADDVSLVSAGSLTLGAYGVQTGAAVVQVSTYGALSYAEGNATSELHAVNHVTLGRSNLISATRDINIAAGQSGDGVWNTMMTAQANSDVYNYTLVPLSTRASAHAKTYNASSLDVGAGSAIKSWQDVTLSAYDVDGTQSADAGGHNPYVAALSLETRSGDQAHSSTSAMTFGSGSSVVAGAAAKETVTVSAAGVVTTTGTDGAPMTGYALRGTWDYHTYLTGQIATATARLADPTLTGEQRAVLQASIDAWNLSLANTPEGALPTVTVGGVFAAAGDLTLRSSSITPNNVSLTANGGAKVSVTSSSPDDLLVIRDITIPYNYATGGHISVLGGASKSGLAGNIHEIDTDVLPVIEISNKGAEGSQAIIVQDLVTNLGGAVNLTNDTGDIDVYGQLVAEQATINAPQGNFINNNPDGNFQLAAPESVWASQQLVSNSKTAAQLVQAGISAAYTDAGYVGGDFLNSWLLFFANSSSSSGSRATLFYNLPVPTNSGGPSGTGYTQYDNKNSAFYFQNATFTATSKSASDSVRRVGQGSVTANNIAINANWIDLGTNINAGRFSNWGFTTVGNYNNSAVDSWDRQYALGQRDGHLIPLYLLPTPGYTRTLGASYDPVTKRIVVADINAAGGGSVYLTGHIANTSRQSLIDVNAGLGQITIVSDVARTLALNNVNTGTTATGKVRITDLENEDQAGNPLTTWYIYDAREGLKTYNNANNRLAGLDGAQLIANPTVGYTPSTSFPDNVYTSYSPASNLRYSWQTHYHLSRTANVGNNFANTVTNWTFTPGDTTITSNGFAVDTAHSNDFDTSLSATYSGSPVNIRISASGQYGLRANPMQVYAVNSIDLYENSSVKADNPATIGFRGSATGMISVTTPGAVVVTGAVNNPLGTLSVNGSSLGVTGSGRIVTGALTTVGATLGTAMTALPITLKGNPTSATGADLTVSTSSGSVNLAVDGRVALGTISVAGDPTSGRADLKLSATGGIYATSTVPISAGDLTLDGGSGSIGTATQPILVGNTRVANFALPASGVLTATATGGIYLTKTVGDLLVGSVSSLGDGDVVLTSRAAILNALTGYTIDDVVQQNLASTWSKLHLTDSTGASAVQDTVRPFEKTVVADYNEYWFIQHNASVSSGVVALTPQQIAVFQGQANASLGGATATPAQVRNFVQGRYDSINGFLQGAFGSNPPVGSNSYAAEYQAILTNATLANGRVQVSAGRETAFDAQYQALVTNQTGLAAPTHAQVLSFVQAEYDTIKDYLGTTDGISFYTYQPGWTFTLSPTSAAYATLTRGAGQWTTQQLSNAINSSALLPVSNTQIIHQDPNVTGHNVTLSAGSDIGDSGNSRVIDLRGTLSNSDRAAIAAAAPGAITVRNGSDGLPNQLTVIQRKLVGLDAAGVISASAGGNLFLNSDGLGRLAQVSTGGAVQLYFGQGIVNVGQPANGLINGFSVLLESGSGSIGSAANPITLNANVASVSSVRAAQDVYLKQLSGTEETKNLTLGLAYAGGVLGLTADGGSIASPYAPSSDLHWQGGSIVLQARDNLGTAARPLQLTTSSGNLTAKAAGTLIASDPSGVLNLGDVDVGSASLTGTGFRFNRTFRARTGINVSTAGLVGVSDRAQIRTQGALSLTGGVITAGRDALIEADRGASLPASLTLVASSGRLQLGSGINQVTLVSDGTMLLNSAQGLEFSGRIKGQDATQLTAGGLLQLDSSSTIDVFQGALGLNGGAVTVGDAVKSQSSGFSIQTAGAAVGGTDVDLNSRGPNALTITAGSLTTGRSFKAASEDAVSLSATAGSLTLGSANNLDARSNLLLTARDDVTTGDALRAQARGGYLAVQARTITGGANQSWTSSADIGLTASVGALRLGMGDVFRAPSISLGSRGLMSIGSGAGIYGTTAVNLIAGADLVIGATPSESTASPVKLQTPALYAHGNSVTVGAPVVLSPASAVSLTMGLTQGQPSLSFAPGGDFDYGAVDRGGSLSINDTNYPLLYTVAQLAALNGSTGRYALATGVTPVGTYSGAVIDSFGGLLEGLGNTVSGLTISATGDRAGLVGTLASTGVLKDIVVAGPTVSGRGYLGALVGDNFGRVINASVVSTVANGVSRGSVAGGGGVGGVIGVNEGGSFAFNVTSAVSVTGTADNVGGIAGSSFGTIANARSTGSVNGRDFVGGVVGFNNASLTGSAAGSVTGRTYVGGLAGLNYDAISGTSSSTVSGTTYVGGLVGWNTSYGTIRASAASGSTTAQGDYAGGLAGVNVGLIDGSTSGPGAVVGVNDVGGLVGLNRGQITGASRSSASVRGTQAVGGLIGWNDTGASALLASGGASGSIRASANNSGGFVGVNYGLISGGAASGRVDGMDYVGGFVGQNATGGQVQASTASGLAVGGRYVGGFAGWNAVATLTDDAASGGASGSGDNVGGFVGANLGTVSGASSGPASVSGTTNIGGLAGLNQGQIARSSSSALVYGERVIGGLVGYNDSSASVDDSYATGPVFGITSVVGDDYVGGLIGVNYGVVRNVYATGLVNGTGVVGGLIGSNQSTGRVSGAYATGEATTTVPAAVGALFGVNMGAVASTYWFPTSVNVYAAGYSPGGSVGTAVAAADRGSRSTYVGFDFSNHWWAAPGDLPILSWQQPQPAVVTVIPPAEDQLRAAEDEKRLRDAASGSALSKVKSQPAIVTTIPDTHLVLSKFILTLPVQSPALDAGT